MAGSRAIFCFPKQTPNTHISDITLKRIGPVHFLYTMRNAVPFLGGLAHKLVLHFQTWSHLDEGHQELSRQLEVVETNIPSVGLVEESEDRLIDRITLYQVSVQMASRWKNLPHVLWKLPHAFKLNLNKLAIKYCNKYFYFKLLTLLKADKC